MRVTPHKCSNCGKLQKIKGNRIYDCNKCGEISDRDINSAKNILMEGIMMLNEK